MALDKLTLNGTELNDETNFVLEAVDFTPPAKKPEWAQSADGDGAALIRTPLYDNRVVTLTVKVAPQASKNAALEKVGSLVDVLQECEKNPGGSPLEWTPASSTKTITLYVLTAAVTSVPMSNEGQGAGFYFGNAPSLVVSLTCKPFGYGAEVEVAAAKSIETGLSVVVLTVPTVAGDVPAEGRLVVKDTAAVGRRFVEWGLENRYYNAATALILDSEDMTPVGGTQKATLTGAYKRAGATNAVISTTLLAEPTICATTGVLKHIGTYRVKARVQATLANEGTAAGVHVRFSYQDGEGPFRANSWQAPLVGGKLVEVDLGEITTTTAITGTQKWLGQVEAYSTNGKTLSSTTDKLELDYLTFIPVLEGYGKARGVQPSGPTTIVAFDNFTVGTLSGSLNARTPTTGAAWATSGATTDFTVEARKIVRATTKDAEPRYGVLGSALGNTSLALAGSMPAVAAGTTVTVGVIARWVNATNYAFLLCEVSNHGIVLASLGVVVAGVTTTLDSWASGNETNIVLGEYGLTLTATLDGGLAATGSSQGGFKLAGTHSSVATGGALASGKGGIYDKNPGNGAVSRVVSSVNVSQLAAIPYCVQPSRTMEARSESTIAADSTGVYFGPVPQYRGSRFYVPQDGSANRTSRILVKADRNDLEASDQQTIADAFTAQVFATPRYSVIPR